MTQVYRYPSSLPEEYGESCVAVGMFDGLHRGHQAVLERLSDLSQSNHLSSRVVVSFHPHPAQVLGKRKNVLPISTLRELLEDLDVQGVSALYLIRFTKEFSRLSSEEFLNEICVKKLRAKGFVIGPDTALGKDREGGPPVIEKFFEGRGGVTARVAALAYHGKPVGSTTIRECLSLGDVEQVNQLLGRPYRIVGKVRRGDGRGTPLGFATANIVPGRRILPQLGVYACFAVLRGERFRAVCNIGIRPTFGGKRPRLEVHILDDFSRELYGESLEVHFLKFIREERAFDGPSALIEQISHDVEEVKAYFIEEY
ncbi:MAG: riboflavin biosynthesis protein RibF [Bdellovibrionales bacterium]|nr:riboflavin biosynthesis protein RibF [Bdellovibrionales bacterium]